MDTSNLFERIEGYAQENFATETLAYILETDAGVRNAFLKLLLSRRRKPPKTLRKALRSCRIDTQQTFDFGRPDMTITSANGRGATVFVEVKTQSPEGDGQVKKYLKHGHVAYLTPRGHDEPDLDGADNKKYLGQFFWHEVHSVIQGYGSHNTLHKQFLKYLEARRMGPLEPISKKDLSASLHAADVISKFQALVDAVRMEIEPDWKREFGSNIGGKKADWGSATGDLPYWWFRVRSWVKPERKLFLAIGVYAERGAQDRPRFYVELGTHQKKFGRELETNPKFKRLRSDIGWDASTVPAAWECYKTFPVRTGSIDEIAQRQIKNVRSVKKEICRLVKFVEKML